MTPKYYTLLALFISLSVFSQQKVILNETFEDKTYGNNLNTQISNQKNGTGKIADFSFSNVGYKDNASLKIVKKQNYDGKSKEYARLRISNISLIKNRQYHISFWVRSRSGKGKVRYIIYSGGKDEKYKYATIVNTAKEVKIDNNWQKIEFKIQAIKKSRKGDPIDLKKLNLIIGFEKFSRGIYLLDDIKIVEKTP